MRSATGALILFIVLIVGIVFIWFFYGPIVRNYIFSRIVNPFYENSVGNTVNSVSKVYSGFYSSFQTALNVLSNPDQYAESQLFTSQPQQQQIYNYYIKLSPITGVAGVAQNNMTTPTVSEFIFQYSLPSNQNLNNNVQFNCTYSYPIELDYCFSNFVNETSSSPTSISLSSFNGINTIECNYNTKLNYSSCPYLNNQGFYIYNTLNAVIYDINATSLYNFLAVSIPIAAVANQKNENIYQYLNLNENNYDVDLYNSLYNYPYIEIARVGKSTGYPVLLQNQDTSYDVILLSISSLQNLANINSWSIQFIYNNNEINLEYLSNSGCSDSYSFGNNYSYALTCGGNSCNIIINNKYLQYLQNSNNNFIVAIPICISGSSGFSGYSTISVVSDLSYNYLLSASNTLNYYPG
ncbi:hypothetical protein MJ1_0468 [Nanobdella aerobiophila]|uniref:Uncharacterized protein n=1 Tax=Nanobdella aerobiophila TaxID=2586965 RepID=A0A915WS78_9ARCH|nr:hypothetical protein [Nanobdella aerobiophila]BBL45626.1 hypothetical protein MJ1_0468 [Nanobdella aerobiophila]